MAGKRLALMTIGLAVITALGSGCATTYLPDYEQAPATAQPLTKSVDGLVVGIDPMREASKLQRYFGADLAQKGVLAVYVVARNSNPSKSFVLSSSHVSLNDTPNSDTAGYVNADAGIDTATAGAFLISPPLLLAGIKNFSDSRETEHSIIVKRLYDTTLEPGEEASGFVYLKLPADDREAQPPTLQMQVYDLDQKEWKDFSFPLDREVQQ